MTTSTNHSWTVTHQFLTGITADHWWRMLRDNKLAVDARYWPRAAYITLMSIVNSLYRREEERDYGAAIAATPIEHAPIFILGHWRSGTTHLHNMLVVDRERFAFPTVYQASFPHTFLRTEHTIPDLVARYAPKTRLFDNVAFNLGLPQEDEFAMCIASGYSSLLGMVFPQRVEYYDRYLTLCDVPVAEIEQWKTTLHWFLQKLTYTYRKQLVLKSPPHTARIRLLLDMFPNARFVHISRDPYAVFQSTRHMYDTMVWNTYLQQPDESRIDELIMRRYVAMYDRYFDERALIPAGQLFELRFEDLRRDPLGQMQALYDTLELDGYAAVEPALRAYVGSLRDYQQNSYVDLPVHQRAQIADAWQRNFAAWGYAR